ncbi:DUF3887 domain-containing protein [Clostridium paraputrificum]|uniref:DUF3887 domain-containing protein n=1 Tax=Clostridium TaxID=1485 RepID=UPI003D358DE9
MRGKFLTLASIIIVLLLTITGCSKKIEHNEVSSYSDQILSSILLALTQSNYNEFASYLNDDMKETFDNEVFEKESRTLIDNAGFFESLSFIEGKKNKGYVSLIYYATFTDEPDGVKISITFKEEDPEHKVYQLYLSSPKLSEASSKT